jgi:hypothetical protein
VPGPIDLIRLTALAVFLALVAVGLWLLDVAWWVIPPVMLVALVVAWTIEWLAWRQGRLPVVVGSVEEAVAVAPPAHEEAPHPPVQAIQPPTPPEPEAVTRVEPPPEPMPEPEPEPEPVPQPEPEPEPEPVPVPETPPEPVATPAPEPEEPAEPLRRPRRMRLRPVPSPRPELQPEPAPPQPAEASVVALRPRTFEPRQWNLWDLERIAREQRTNHPERRDEWAYLFLNLRQFAHADGSLPTEFDGLVRESFEGLLEPSYRP